MLFDRIRFDFSDEHLSDNFMLMLHEAGFEEEVMDDLDESGDGNINVTVVTTDKEKLSTLLSVIALFRTRFEL